MAFNLSIEQTALNGTNGNTQHDSTATRIIKVLACSVVLLVALVGNIFIILVVRQKNVNKKKTINFFIMNMAVSDLVVPIVILPRIIVTNLTDSTMVVTWRAMDGIPGNILCKFVFFVSDLTMVVSILSIICIAIDRFCAVVFPMKLSLITSKVRCCLIVFTWAFSIAIFSPFFYGFKLVQFQGKQVCALIWSDDNAVHFEIQQSVAIAASVLLTVIPAILLTIIYTVILVVTRIQIVPDQQHSITAMNRRQANNNKLLKLAFLTVGSFAICYGPYNVFLLYLSIGLNWNMDQTPEINTFRFVAHFLTYTNSALNPCLYFIFIENYRRGLKKILKLSPERPNNPNLTELISRGTVHSRLPRRSMDNLLTPLNTERQLGSKTVR